MKREDLQEKRWADMRPAAADPGTREEAGDVFHVTRERIRQIEAKALRKLRRPARSRRLADYVR